MRAGGMDQRPQILDFSSRIEDVRARRDLAWPCHAFRVTIPVRPAGHLNVFEETILKLLDQARLDERALAETTCLEAPFITLVCCRLRDLGLLTERYDVTALGRAQLSLAAEGATEYELRIVFRERIGGALLPIVYAGDLRYEEIVAWRETGRSVDVRKAGDHSVRLRLLRSAEGRGSARPPTPAEVLSAANRHRELSRQYAALRRGVAPCPPVVRARQMNVHPDPENVFLRCQVVVPAVGDEHRIGDPFGYGFSQGLFRTYEALRSSDPDEQEFIRRLRSQAFTVRVQTPSSDGATGEARAAVLARLSEAVARFAGLFAKLQQAERELRTSRHPPRNRNEEAHFAYHGRQAAQSLCEALEAALGYVVSGSRPAACEATLGGGGQNHEANGALLLPLAKGLGLRTDGIGGLLQVAPGRVRGLRDGMVDLQALLAVTLAAAAEEPGHALRRLAAGFDGWLLFLRELKAARDAGAHGQSRAAGSRQLEGLREATYRSIELLLPSLQRDVVTAGPAGARPVMDEVHDARRKAVSSLEARFGVHWYAGLGTDAAELLTQVELAAAALPGGSAEAVNVARTVNDLASALQVLVHARQPAAAEALGPDEPPRERARRRAIEAGLLHDGVELPACLANVNPRRLREAMQGRSPTLGASVMALLLLASPEWLRGVMVASPGFLEVCARVAELRGHGNRPVVMTPDGLRKLKDEVYGACGALMEG